MVVKKVGRRRFVSATAAASTALVAAPFVRGAYAAGQVSVFFWDHWVPAGNDEIKKQVTAWSNKNKVEVKADFITSQGRQNLLTINAEAQARSGHDIITIGNWNVREHADKLEVVDDVVGRLVASGGEANEVAHYLGKNKGKWVAVPSSWGTQNKGPAARISMMKEYAGIDVVKMYPAEAGVETAEAKAWDNEAMLKAAEACAKAGKPFGIGLGTTADNVDTAGSLFASFGAELVDAKGNIQIKSAAVRQALEYCQKLVKFLPADAQSWDDASNNRALIAGNASLIYNPPSAWAVAVRDAPAVAADTWHFPTPTGPKGRFVPHSMNFWGIWQFAKNKSAAKDLIEFLMQPDNVDARSTSVMGYDLPPFAKMAESKVWDKIGPPEGSLFNYPVRKQHNAVPHLAHMPAPPEIAVQIYNRGTLPTMFAKMKAGESIDQVITWGNRELEGFL
ncbi:ABC transporter substrate-binding protein [Reyranella soli]|uniref:ABC transporter substrate-binding protein n=1 Tax=Reyranella soli TaxID=1230389 RepID=A0A512N255_9HYPH|nr:extracellular solute-binding protein [Reyranella soli]GEP53062.1 ABC transporter substrate-binding protein [Reyranella soli]